MGSINIIKRGVVSIKLFEPFETSGFLIKLADTQEELNNVYRLRYLDLVLAYRNDKTDLGIVDKDEYDEYCDHLIAIDLKTNEIAGTYRLIRKEHLYNLNDFLTEKEFNIDNIKSDQFDILELGRAVVKEEYRQSNVISFLWKGLIRYAINYNIKFMFGTACFHGIDPLVYKKELSYLYHYHRPSNELKTYARKSHASSINLLPIEEIDIEADSRELPALIKGYLRLGAYVSEDAFIDIEFNALDVLILLEIEKINPRYIKKYLG